MGEQAALVKRRAALLMAVQRAAILICRTLGLKTGRYRPSQFVCCADDLFFKSLTLQKSLKEKHLGQAGQVKTVL